jgi:AcrR family transcriptional regulator
MPGSRGRPRSSAIDDAVRRAVVQLLAEHGYVAMSVERVAATAGVAKTAIYRRWASKAELVFAMAIHSEALEPAEDRGSLAADLRVLTERVVALLADPVAVQALPGLLADLRGDPSLAQRFQAVFVSAERRLIQTLLDRAARRGELSAPVDAADVHAQLLGSAFAWVFLFQGDLPPDLSGRIATAVLITLQK